MKKCFAIIVGMLLFASVSVASASTVTDLVDRANAKPMASGICRIFLASEADANEAVTYLKTIGKIGHISHAANWTVSWMTK